MKTVIKAIVAAIWLTMVTIGANAADWNPPGPVKLLIAFGAGGGADTQARLIASALEEKHGWKFIPEQATGKGGLNMLTALSANSDLNVSDFTGLSTTAGFQLAIVGQTEDGYKTMHDVIKAAKGGKEISVGTMSPRIADLVYLIEKEHGVKFNTVGYRGGRLVLDAINAGDVDIGFVAGPQGKGVSDGELVELASAMDIPLNMTPDAPLMSDLGVEFHAAGHFVFVAPGGLSAEAQKAFADAIEEVVNDPDQKVAQIIKRVFGGPKVIKGKQLDAHLQTGYDEASKLLAAVEE